ncbi:MAG: zinc ribbon domain-containing protein [Victivallaceae bacterium]|nr:zinc ribbon domain-containing protein [Victivallaceae bacterium]
MKKSLITHIIIMIIAAVLGAYLASLLTVQRLEIIKTGSQLSKLPLGGFNKFTSDVQWMLFINYCGGLSAVKKENVGEIYKRLNAILANDPNHEMAYEMGGMMFSVRDPQKAVEIFTRGADNPNLKKNWKLPFYAGFVLTQHLTDQDDPERLKKAEEMFRKALTRDNSMPHVFSALIRTRAKRIAQRKDWRGIPIVNDKHAYLCALFDEWRKSGEISGAGPNEEVFSGESVTVSDFRPRILEAAQKAKASAPTNKYILRTIDEVVKKVLKDDHLCPKCLTVYGPGDKFCSACGTAVEVYGTCPRCKAVMKGSFCSACGCPQKGVAAKPAVAKPAVAKPPAVKPAAKTLIIKPAAKRVNVPKKQ